jgi:small subunit ribosomal protein S20
MATHKSAVKRHRQEEQRRMRNRAHRTRLRSQVKRIRKALSEGDVEAARSLLPATLSLIDHTAKLGAVHDNSAARTKSRLTRAVNRLAAGA